MVSAPPASRQTEGPPSRHPWSLGLRARLTIALLLVALLVSAGTTAAMLMAARHQVMSDLRHRLSDIVSVAATGLDADLQIQVTPRVGMDSEAYRALAAELRRIRDSTSDLYFVYTMRQEPDGAIRFVGDAEENPADVAPLDSTYEDASPLLRGSFAAMDGPVVETTLYSDQWGTWLSGYAPIVGPDGQRVGVLGADIAATTVTAHERKVLWLALIIFVGALPLILALGLLLGRTLTRPLATLTDGAQRIADGDLSVRLGLRSGDEIGTLAHAFDTMAERLSNTHDALREAARKYRDIFENTVEGIFQSTPDGRLLTANRAMLDMLGYDDLPQAQARIDNLAEAVYVRPEDRAALLEDLNRHGRVDGFEAPLRRSDGTVFWSEISMRPLRQSDTTEPDRDGVVLEGMVLDITERRQRQQAEREREAAHAANEAKSGFLANMSHEIRTPLNAIMGLTDLVLRTDLTDRQRDYLSKVRISSTTLLAVINDILDLSKIEAGRLDLEQTAFSLDEVLANLTEMFAYRAHERDIELIVSAEPNVPRALIGDPVRLGQILINLTGNAIKFTESGEVAVTVCLTALPDDDDGDSPPDRIALRVDVRDTGPGIPEDRLDAIFQSFAQADGSITRRHGGTGLGLAISRQLAALMDGTITVTSTVGEGSTFSATVVLRRQAETAEARPVTPADLRGLRVLIADDNATSRQILVDQIESFGMHATAAVDGAEALDLLSRPDAAYDLVLMDWKMPGMNGLEAARRIRTDLALDKTPVVCMVSAYAREDLMHQTDRTVLDAFLHKPVNQSFLFDTIVNLFGHPDAAVADALVARAASTGDDADAATPPRFDGRRVLLVEDIEVNRMVAMEWLTSAGLAVDIAENGRTALDAVDPARHAAVLMDLQMPVMDGLEATRHIRARPGHADLPIIAMTAHALKGDLERCLAAGMTDYVAKPIDPARLFAALRRCIPETPAGEGKAAEAPSPTPTPESVPADLTLPGIDRTVGLSRANGNEALYLKMLRGFRDSWADVTTRAEQDMAAGRAAEARRAVHSVKGVAGNIGAMALYEAGERAEAMIADGTFDPDADIWQAFTAAHRTVIEGLAALPEAAPPPPSPAESPAPTDDGPSRADLTARLDRLIPLLDDDLGRARDELGALRPTLCRILGIARVDALQSAIEDFDIDAAIAALEEMRKDIADDDE